MRRRASFAAPALLALVLAVLPAQADAAFPY
jgi:hypothetical protein